MILDRRGELVWFAQLGDDKDAMEFRTQHYRGKPVLTWWEGAMKRGFAPGSFVIVDNDPIVLAHGRAILATDDNTAVVTADMRHPAEVLNHPETTKLIDFDAPVGVLLIAMGNFLTVEERPAVMGRLRDALPSGSYITTTHVTVDDQPADAVAQIENTYAATPTPIYFRKHAEVARFFDGFELVDPGLVTLDAWRPDPADPAPPATGWLYGAVGCKPFTKTCKNVPVSSHLAVWR